MRIAERVFQLKAHKTKVSTEFLAGMTIFMTTAFIIAVNPEILAVTGMDRGGLFTATIIATIVPTLLMAFLAKYPFAVAPGMGMNAYFAFVVARELGWELALIALFFQGIAFVILASVKFREKILESIPYNLKLAFGVGIGVFITLIGFQGGGFIVDNPDTMLGLGELTSPTTLLFLAGCVITAILLANKIRGGIFLGIIITYLLGLICQLLGIYVGPSLIPQGIIAAPPSIADVSIFAAFRGADWVGVDIFRFITIFIAFFIVDVLDTVGTLIGVSEKAGFLDKNGKLPRARQAFLADAIGTVAGAAAGTSTTTTYIESAAGIAEGGRTGLTALFVAIFFAACLFFWPVFSVIPTFATAPALVMVGFYMMGIVVKIDFRTFAEGFPAFLTIILIPFTYSVSNGLVFGILSYVILKLFTGRAKEISVIMYVLSAFFILKLIIT